MKKIALAAMLAATFATSAFAADEMKKEANTSASPANASAADKIGTQSPSAGKSTYTLADKKTKVEVENGLATVDGKAAPEGIHHTQDGKTITIGKGGKVESVK